MVGGLLILLTLSVLAFAAVTGLVAALIGKSADLPMNVGFGWGAVLGPIGIAVVIFVVIQRKRSPIQIGDRYY